MLYKKLLELKEDTQNITDLETTHRYLRSLEGIPTLHVQVLQQVFVEFGNSYTSLDVYNNSERLKLTHAHYEASITFKASASTSCANQTITFFFKGQNGAFDCINPTFLQLL
jgi:hypothetical protein